VEGDGSFGAASNTVTLNNTNTTGSPLSELLFTGSGSSGRTITMASENNGSYTWDEGSGSPWLLGRPSPSPAR